MFKYTLKPKYKKTNSDLPEEFLCEQKNLDWYHDSENEECQKIYKKHPLLKKIKISEYYTTVPVLDTFELISSSYYSTQGLIDDKTINSIINACILNSNWLNEYICQINSVIAFKELKIAYRGQMISEDNLIFGLCYLTKLAVYQKLSKENLLECSNQINYISQQKDKIGAVAKLCRKVLQTSVHELSRKTEFKNFFDILSKNQIQLPLNFLMDLENKKYVELNLFEAHPTFEQKFDNLILSQAKTVLSGFILTAIMEYVFIVLQLDLVNRYSFLLIFGILFFCIKINIENKWKERTRLNINNNKEYDL